MDAIVQGPPEIPRIHASGKDEDRQGGDNSANDDEEKPSSIVVSEVEQDANTTIANNGEGEESVDGEREGESEARAIGGDAAVTRRPVEATARAMSIGAAVLF